MRNRTSRSRGRRTELAGDLIVAAIDMKTDRRAGRLLIRRRTCFTQADAGLRSAIDGELVRFRRFQLSRA